jgi:hypothetical protein
MKKKNVYQNGLFFVALLLLACTHSSDNKKMVNDKPEGNKLTSKPPSSYQDTLKIDVPVALFYSPDTVQLQKIKKITEDRVFESQIHEYFYQMRNARIVLKKSWPSITIIDAKNVRYLLFNKENNVSVCIDLNKYDPFGIFLFNTKKDPHPPDMMNIESELSFYFAK